MDSSLLKEVKIAVIGLGYVGLPLAVAFAKKYPVVGYDINPIRVEELLTFRDRTLEVNESDLASGLNGMLQLTYDAEMLAKANVYIVTVPTPINMFKAPDLEPLRLASQLIGKFLCDGDLVIYESTTYPGCTEEDCVPILEETSGLRYNQDFYCGYSPERINPGDKVNTLTQIKKVTSGSTPAIADFVDELYASIISAGTFKASSIAVAEASKAIENAQRDVNISFVNELALIFDRLEIDTTEVLAAAGTKWNFLPFKPGLVGGHCIGVDPYYLAYKAQSVGYHPQVILSGRRVNDNMGMFVANKVVKLMIQKSLPVKGAKALILGITFKENCPDIRNTRVIDIKEELNQFGMEVDIYDPWANPTEVYQDLAVSLTDTIPAIGTYSAVILAVAHTEFLALFNDLKEVSSTQVRYDTKAYLPIHLIDGRL